ncbi:MAG: CRISPR-associated endonuclease Cas2 [Methylococcaceae bacterium]|nr:CRISPR-associated endonuclease Cas2 [Methylococcaceae bacterium]
MKIYLACFDISDDKNRDRVDKELMAYGERVQKSVFEIIIRQPQELDALCGKLAPLLEAGDDLRFYPLCAECRSHSTNIRGERLAHFPAAVVI